MTQRVTIAEIKIFDRTLPLVSRYFQAPVCADRDIAKTYEFTQYTTSTETLRFLFEIDLLANPYLYSTLGGHSLTSMRVVARLEKATGVRINPGELIVQTLG